MSRVQLALNVGDIDEAVAFYSKLFGAEPAKRRAVRGVLDEGEGADRPGDRGRAAVLRRLARQFLSTRAARVLPTRAARVLPTPAAHDCLSSLGPMPHPAA